MRHLLGACCLIAAPVLASAEVVVADAYARVSRPNAPTGAIFMEIRNTGDQAVRLVAVQSEIAERAELHTHVQVGDGIVSMQQIEGGIVIEAGASHLLQRGADHVMLMGLSGPLEQGQTVPVVLIFEEGDSLQIAVPVDNARKPDPARP